MWAVLKRQLGKETFKQVNTPVAELYGCQAAASHWDSVLLQAQRLNASCSTEIMGTFQPFVCFIGRWLYGAFRDQLLFPLVWHQRIQDDRHAVSVQRIDHLSLELSRCGHCRTVPHRPEVC